MFSWVCDHVPTHESHPVTRKNFQHQAQCPLVDYKMQSSSEESHEYSKSPNVHFGGSTLGQESLQVPSARHFLSVEQDLIGARQIDVHICPDNRYRLYKGRSLKTLQQKRYNRCFLHVNSNVGSQDVLVGNDTFF